MRAFLPEYHLQQPANLEEVLQLIQQNPGRYRPLAGGTDIMVLLAAGKLPKGEFLDLSRCSSLRGIEVSTDTVSLGALTTYREIKNHSLLQTEFPNLVQAAAMTGATAIQNRATLGGNVANASPAADSAPALLSYGARIRLISARGVRELDYADFHQDYKKTAMAADELIAALIVPRFKKPAFHFYRKVGTRKAQAISKVCLSACIGERVRLGFGAVAPVPAPCLELAQALTQLGPKALTPAIVQILHRVIAPIDDVRSSAVYRRRVAENLLHQMWEQYRQWSP